MKYNTIAADRQASALRKYRDLCYGEVSLLRVLAMELVLLLVNGLPGALGLWLRGKLYRPFFRTVGRGVVFGRNLTLRHPHKINLGDRVIVDDNAVLDAKGADNNGITIGNNVYVGRNTIVYCKNGDIILQDGVNLSSNCQIFSSHRLVVGVGTVVGAFSYFLSGGEYDYTSPIPFCEQPGKPSKDELRIGANCWIGAHVTVLDGAGIGDHCVIGAGAVVTKPVPADSLAVGAPARVVKSIGN